MIVTKHYAVTYDAERDAYAILTALSCLWGYHVRPWDQTASCDRLGWRVSLVSAASMAVPSLSELSPRAPGLHGPAAPL